MNRKTVWPLAVLAVIAATHAFATEEDRQALEALLDEFLANVGSAGMHDRFWDEDLIYTSSDGTRFDKAAIMAGFDRGDDEVGGGDGSGDDPSPSYTAEDVRVNVYGNTAVVAFRLVADAGDGAPTRAYFNTGTFVKRAGRWRAVAWQATAIPPPEE